ncbi:hypothetical protein AVEN_214913-1 [Araneus ventricosus]|uniref:Uncharacterized protein n=1 Tax=Araneus ventricosus TaxID=182803 RepID=A0A4Y2QPF0_ARAVE|nr:hypothetical protein AVEN_214913-1 [Araneus ventricosus]
MVAPRLLQSKNPPGEHLARIHHKPTSHASQTSLSSPAFTKHSFQTARSDGNYDRLDIQPSSPCHSVFYPIHLVGALMVAPRLLQSKNPPGEHLARIHHNPPPTHPKPLFLHRHSLSTHSKFRGVMEIMTGLISNLPLHAKPIPC